MISFLKEPSTRVAILAAVLWHMFWFFGITVDFSPRIAKEKAVQKIYFLGPVLSDESFDMIIESKPVLGETVYRDFPEAKEMLEPEIEKLGRKSPGSLVSVPAGGEMWSALRGALSEPKVVPRRSFYEKFPIAIAQSPYPISGELKSRDIFHIPEERPNKAKGLLSAEFDVVYDAEFEIAVDPNGKVVYVENIISTGHLEMDLLWKEYLKKWQFMPLREEFAKDQTGRIRVPSDMLREPQ